MSILRRIFSMFSRSSRGSTTHSHGHRRSSGGGIFGTIKRLLR